MMTSLSAILGFNSNDDKLSRTHVRLAPRLRRTRPVQYERVIERITVE